MAAKVKTIVFNDSYRTLRAYCFFVKNTLIWTKKYIAAKVPLWEHMQEVHKKLADLFLIKGSAAFLRRILREAAAKKRQFSPRNSCSFALHFARSGTSTIRPLTVSSR